MNVLITGTSSGIGKACAEYFLKKGHRVYGFDRNDFSISDENYTHFCLDIRNKTAYPDLPNMNIIVNNAGVQFPQQRIQDISEEQLYTTFEVNVFSMFYFVKAVLDHGVGCKSIINTASVTAYQGETDLLDYSATKGAIVSFTRALSQSLAEKNIRVNAVAPGPIWTSLIPASFSAEKVARFGQDVPMRRAGQPCELAPAYVYLASGGSSYVTGQVIHVNGGTITGS